MGDFLRKNARTAYAGMYLAAGVLCQLSTNSPAIVEAAQQSFFPTDDSPASADFSINLWVDEQSQGIGRWPKPYVRGLDHLVYLGFDAGSSIAINLRSRHIIGRVSPEFAADGGYWNRVVFPMLLSVISGSAGVAELHCACVTHGEDGMLLSGPSRSGKSTLAVALGSLGLRFLSDDRTFCSLREGELSAWGLLADLKLRAEAHEWFPQSKGHCCSAASGEPEVRLPPENLSLRRSRRCKPRCLVFLDRRDMECFCLSSVSEKEAAERLEADLMAELPETTAHQSAVISCLVNISSAVLRYGGSPWTVAPKLAAYFEGVCKAPIKSGALTGPASHKSIALVKK